MTKAAQKIWNEVDRYFDRLIPSDPALGAALAANRKAELPAIDVTPLQGKFLELLVRITGAHRVLEIGTLGGYSTLWLARALPHGGQVVTLELEPRHAEIARANLQNAGMADRVDVRVGRAADLLRALVAGNTAPFDLIFIDADKPNNPTYLEWAVKLSRKGTLIVVDNVIRDGKIADTDSTDPAITGTRRMFEMLAAHPSLEATALQTVGSKGYDGLAFALVR